MKQHNKLVRDNILDIIKKDGIAYTSRILNDDEYKKELLLKVIEEAKEVVDTKGDPLLLITEIADVLEVISSIIKAFNLNASEIDKVKNQRREIRGGFDKKIYLESTED